MTIKITDGTEREKSNDIESDYPIVLPSLDLPSPYTFSDTLTPSNQFDGKSSAINDNSSSSSSCTSSSSYTNASLYAFFCCSPHLIH